MEGADRQKLAARAQQLKPAMNIGKAGLTTGVVDEVRRQLEEQRLLKVKLLASARGGQATKDLAAELAERAGAELVEVRGNTVVLWRKRRPRARAEQARGDAR